MAGTKGFIGSIGCKGFMGRAVAIADGNCAWWVGMAGMWAIAAGMVGMRAMVAARSCAVAAADAGMAMVAAKSWAVVTEGARG